MVVLGDPESRQKYDAHGEEPKPEGNKLKTAMELLNGTALAILEDENVAEGSVDLIQVLRQTAQKNRTDQADAIVNWERKLTKLARSRRRIIRKHGENNFLAAACDQRVMDMKRTLAEMTERRDVFDLQLELLNDFMFERDAPAEWRSWEHLIISTVEIRR
jgi:hypothetical protein